ncbi:MAG: SIR2 family protein [Candidatus Eisenbacteria bacterium]|uniref:SIR2 family protein n=1 Tax=Eiseniibacteriota bacterium TaxID=2212470 RepID=A0A948W5S9_UNCEI|nr:SIR2 family protein [Candidatus Eisenbacteria bacterium]MBU1949386.1 SIR2 family protein [Candidatus Eisenbacteria bacterium]MBU2690759.1 SIR2 family protein [Candidatus Eisenbacteria bacterium]
MKNETFTGDLLVHEKVINEEEQDRILAEQGGNGNSCLPRRRFGDIVRKYLKPGDKDRVIQLLTQLHGALRDQNEDITELFEEIHSGRALLFVGAGFSLPRRKDGRNEGLTSKELVRRLVAAVPCRDRAKLSGLSLPAVAKYIERMHYDVSIGRVIMRACRDLLPHDPLPQHGLLARLNPFRFVITTNWDRLIEKAYQNPSGRSSSLAVVRRDKELQRIDLEKTTLLKLHGDFEREDFHPSYPPLVTLEECIGHRVRNPVLYSLLSALFATHHIVIVGFRPDDHNFSDLCLRLTHQLKGQLGRIFIVDPGNEVLHRAGPIDVVHIKLSACDFFRYLEKFIAAMGGRMGLSSVPPGGQEMGDTGDSSPHRFWSPNLCTHARKIREALRLRHVEVVRSPGRGGVEAAKVSVGRHAAHLLGDWAQPGDSIALGGGVTLKALVDAVRPEWENFQNVNLFATVTPAFESFSVLAPITLVSLLAERLHAQKVTASAFQLPQRMADVLVNPEERHHEHVEWDPACQQCRIIEDSLAQYLKRVSQCRIFFLGVGSMELEHGGFQEVCNRCAELAEGEGSERGVSNLGDHYRSILREQGYVGDVMYRPFRKIESTPEEGKEFESYFLSASDAKKEKEEKRRTFMRRLYSHVFPIPLEVIRLAAGEDTRQVVLVASGMEKAWPVLSLCHAGLAGALVIDSTLAEEMITLI